MSEMDKIRTDVRELIEKMDEFRASQPKEYRPVWFKGELRFIDWDEYIESMINEAMKRAKEDEK
jgi:hypothetical protein